MPVITIIFLNSLFACFSRIETFKKWILIMSAFNIASSWVLAVHSERSVFDIPCKYVENCSIITGKKICDSTLEKCACAEGNIRMNNYNHCLPFVGMGGHCQDDEQCQQSNPNITCGKWSQRCECIHGHEERENSIMCRTAPQVVENLPYYVHSFGSVGPIHIVLGVLTGSLALLACFAGFIQLVRKKRMSRRCAREEREQGSQFSPDFMYGAAVAASQSHPISDSQLTSTLPSGGDSVGLEDNSSVPQTSGIGDDDCGVDESSCFII